MSSASAPARVRRTPASALAVAVLAVTVLVAENATQAQPSSPSMDVLLDQLSAYLVDYEPKVSELAAEEQYDQWIKRRRGSEGPRVGGGSSGRPNSWGDRRGGFPRSGF